ncbi:hypothetical protein Tco_0001872 [Tanacetum coccineum]
MIVVKNEKDELIPQRTVTEWRVCVDYRKLNNATRKDHFPLPFIDHILERLAGHEYYYFLDGFSATFQRCMMAIFHELIEDNMEVFMDDFSVFGSSFDHCLKNLKKMLKRYGETNLVLNWEKYDFMIKEGIVLGHKVLGSGIKVDKAKIESISKLPYPTNVKAIRSFLGHACLYRRFIKDFSQVACLMTQLLVKYAPLNFSKEFIQAFDKLKQELIWAPIMIKLDWSLPFEIMCDAKLDIEIRDKKGAENLAADHLSRLENPDLRKLTKAEFRDLFPEEQLMTISKKRKEWSHKLDDALWAFRTAFKTLLGTTLFRIIYGKINELDELRLDAYESSISYKERIKRLFPGKLKSRWYGPFTVSKNMKNRAIELYDEDGNEFIVIFDEKKIGTPGRYLEKIHITWAHLEKKRTRLRLYTKSLKEIIIQTVETTSLTRATTSELDQDGARSTTKASECSCLKRNPRSFIEATAS